MGVPKTSDGRPRLAVEVFSGENTPSPVASDRKSFVLPNSFPGEVLLNFTGCSDKPSPPERFGGELFGIQKSGVGVVSQTLYFLDGIFLAGGHIEWSGGGWGSYIYFRLSAPASTIKPPTTPGAGNCNLVPTGMGFNMIVPASGNGSHDIDVPVPIPSLDDESNAQTGYWSYSEPWVGKGVVSPGTPGASKYNLFDTSLELARFIKVHLLHSEGQRDFIAPAIKPKWVLPEWELRVDVYNAGTGVLSVSWDLLIARRKSV